MKRSQLVFCTAVFSALLTGILVEQSRKDGQSMDFRSNEARLIPFEDLAVPPAIHAVEGTVVDHTGQAAAEVLIQLARNDLEPGQAEPMHVVRTDADGSFRVEGLGQGTYDALLMRMGHQVAREIVAVPADDSLQWQLAEPLTPIRSLPEVRRSRFEGRLQPPVGFTEKDTPLENYFLRLEPTASVDELGGAVARSLPVDAGGFFGTEDLVEAEYHVRVLPLWAKGGSWPVLDETLHEHGTQGPPLALRVKAGEVQGRLVDTGRHAIEGALVQVWPLGNRELPWPPQQTDSGGWFSIGDLPPGPYEVQVQAGGTKKQMGVQVRAGEREFLRFNEIDVRGEGGD